MSKKSPQLRFEGFTDDWEQRKLGDVISISSEKNGNQFSRADVLSVSREAGVVNQIEYQGRSFAGASIANYRVVHKGDLIYTKSPLKGAPNGIFKTSEVEGIVSPLYAVYQSREANAAFVGWLLSNDNFATHYLYPLVNKGSKNTLLVSDADAISGHLSFPNIEEQAKIVSFFTQLDNLIALHQRKLDLLKEQKKGYLQKMFPKNGAKVPKLRFAGFADDWEERKLGDYVIIRSGWSPSNFDINNNANNLFIKVDDLNYSTRVQKESQVKVNILSKYKKMKKSSTIFPKRGAAIMTNKVRMLGEDSYMDTNMMALEPKGIDPEYLYTFINKTGLYKIADTSTIPQINNKHIEPYLLLIPSLEEQHKIGSFFKQLDETIALHQRKLDLLKEQKKGFLQKMFV